MSHYATGGNWARISRSTLSMSVSARAFQKRDHGPACSSENGRASGVGLQCPRVLGAIEFDDKATLYAGKIRNERPDAVLTAELVTEQATVTKLVP